MTAVALGLLFACFLAIPVVFAVGAWLDRAEQAAAGYAVRYEDDLAPFFGDYAADPMAREEHANTVAELRSDATYRAVQTQRARLNQIPQQKNRSL